MTVALLRRGALLASEPDVGVAGTLGKNTDGFQEWWGWPFHTYRADLNRIYTGSVSSTGEICAWYDDFTTGQSRRYVVGQSIVDDHCRPALYIQPGRRPVIMWTNHNSDGVLHCKVGTVDSVNSLKSATDQTATSTQLVSYTQMHKVDSLSSAGADVFIVFSRYTGGGAGSNYTWRFRTLSVDQATGVATWSAAVLMVQTVGAPQLYMQTVPENAASGDQKLRAGIAYNAAAPVHDQHYIEINLTTGTVTDDQGATVANIWTAANLPITAPNLPKALSSPTTPTRLLAVRPGPAAPAIFSAVFSGSSPKLRLKELSAGVWSNDDLGNPGDPVYDDSNRYIGGGNFDNPCTSPDKVYNARGLSGTWTVDRITRTGGVWTRKTLKSSVAVKYTRPETVNGGPGDVYVNAVTRYTGYTDYYADVIAVTDPPPPTAIPTNTAAPVASTTGAAIAGRVANTTTGDWDQPPWTAEYRWTRDGSVITSSGDNTHTTANYTLQVADQGTVVKSGVRVTNTIGTSAWVDSAALAVATQPASAFRDFFTEAAVVTLQTHVSDSGAGWARVFGSVSHQVDNTSGTVRQNSSSSGESVSKAAYVPATANYWLQGRWIVKTNTGGIRPGLRVVAAGMTDPVSGLALQAGDGYFAEYRADLGVYRIHKRVNAVATQLSPDIAVPAYASGFSNGSARYVRFQVTGSTLLFAVVVPGILLTPLEVEAQAEQLWSGDDPDISAAGGIGIWSTAATATATARLHLDDLYAFEPTAPGA